MNQFQADRHSLTCDSDLQFFAVKIFDITVNSMADERTASTMNWLNSALRSSQKSSTIINQVQIRQWALMNPERVCTVFPFFITFLLSRRRTKSLPRNQQSNFVTWTVLFLIPSLIAIVAKGYTRTCKQMLTCRTSIRTRKMTGWTRTRTQRSNVIQCTGLATREYLLVTRMLILMLLDCWTCYQRSRWRGQAGHLNNRTAQFRYLRRGLYSGTLHCSSAKLSK